MTIEELSGACIMTGIRGPSLDNADCRADVQLLKKHRIKNIILFDTHLPTGGLRNIVNEEQICRLTDDLRNELGDDLIIGIDQEGGEVNRLRNFQDPAISEMLSARMQGAMSEPQLRATIDPVARVLSEIGINLCFAPCVDLEINPQNPIIAGKGRSLGRDPDRVTNAAATIINAYHLHGVRCCIKHYPGHGSTSVDTHHGLADITSTKHDDEQLVFKNLINRMNQGSTPKFSAMTAHLIDQSVDANHPASLSKAHTTDRLRGLHNFDGLVFTDSLDMDAIRSSLNAGQAALRAIQAGADIALDGFNAPDACEHPSAGMHSMIVDAVSSGILDESVLVQAARRRLSLFGF